MTKTFGFIFLCLKQITLNLISFGLKLIMKIHFKDKKVKMQPKKVFKPKIKQSFFWASHDHNRFVPLFLEFVCVFLCLDFIL